MALQLAALYEYIVTIAAVTLGFGSRILWLLRKDVLEIITLMVRHH